MAKGVEDTAFYRYFRLSALNEVGGDPGRFGVSLAQFHEANTKRSRDWPAAMTTLSTHDTKRSEDVRARLVLLAQCPREWADAVTAWQALAHDHRSAAGPDPATEQLVWQTLVGAWPLSADRAVAYVEKATREAKDRTSWTEPAPAFDQAVATFVRGVLGDERIRDAVAEFVAHLAPAWRATALAQKAVQLTVPGVADTYQGTELFDLSLVDPDNRRDVDFDERRERLRRLDAGEKPADLDDEKLLVTAHVLRIRREHPEWFVGAGSAYVPMPTSTGNAVAFGRGTAGADGGPPAVTAVAVATRLPVALDRHGGWGEHTLALPEGTWRDELTGRELPGGTVRLADVLADLPVAFLVRG
jgi:(1->4)-alpha-D-glucan 1-alpha-D-glucosylmutase